MMWKGCTTSCALAAIAALSVAACSSTNLAGTYPKGGSVIPDTQLRLTPGYTLPLEKLVYWGAAAAVAYYVTDPFAPNWEIAEAKFPGDHYRLSLHMKRFYSGGAGESRVVFNRRAKELMLSGGFDGYQILDYDEGLESSVLGSQRVAEGTILLTHSDRSESNQGMPPPALSTTPRFEKPRS